jgi:hypothetical protein
MPRVASAASGLVAELLQSEGVRLRLGTLFGWKFDDFGEDYASVHGSGLEAGFNRDPASKSKASLPIQLRLQAI